VLIWTSLTTEKHSAWQSSPGGTLAQSAKHLPQCGRTVHSSEDMLILELLTTFLSDKVWSCQRQDNLASALVFQILSGKTTPRQWNSAEEEGTCLFFVTTVPGLMHATKQVTFRIHPRYVTDFSSTGKSA